MLRIPNDPITGIAGIEAVREYIVSAGMKSCVTFHIEFGEKIDLVFIFDRSGFHELDSEHTMIQAFLERNPDLALFSLLLKDSMEVRGKVLYRAWRQMMTVKEHNAEVFQDILKMLP